MTADCRGDKDIKKKIRRQNAVGNMLVITSHLHLLRQNSNCSSHIVTPYMNVLIGVIHTRTLLENLLSVIVTHSSLRLINVPRNTSSSLAFEMNATGRINVVFRKFASSLMIRVTASPTVLFLPLSIAMLIISLHCWISGRGCYMYRNNHRYNFLSICQCMMNDFVIN